VDVFKTNNWVKQVLSFVYSRLKLVLLRLDLVEVVDDGDVIDSEAFAAKAFDFCDIFFIIDGCKPSGGTPAVVGGIGCEIMFNRIVMHVI
jgi:hypothetical protein